MNVKRYRKNKIATALYIDDDESTATMDKNKFKRYGIEITIASDGARAVDKYMEMNPDIVYLDLEFMNQPKSGVDILVDLFKADPDFKNKIVLPNSIHMNENDNMGMQFWAKYQELTGREPIAIIDKLKENKANDLLWVTGHLIEDLVGDMEMNPELKDYIDRLDNEY